MDKVDVRIAPESERDQVVSSLVLGFVTDPVARWCWPAAETYLTSAPKFINIYGGKAFENNSAWTEENYRGGALWLPPGVEPDEEALGELVATTMSEEKQGHLFASLEEIGQHHPTEPHWFLPLIAVEPNWQNRSIGSALMKQAVAVCDEAGVPAYLESSNPRNISLYERIGFKVVGHVQHGDCPPFTPMVREAVI
jgi:ribosomal protein S18 acetylase RimI-like enzyme